MRSSSFSTLLQRVYLDLYYYLFPVHRLRKSGAVIGDNVFWGKNVSVELENAHLLTIEDNVTVSAQTSFILHDSSLQKVANFPLMYGRIHLKEGAYIGAHTVILPGTQVGSRTIVGAKSLIKGTLRAHSVYVGQPARRISSVPQLQRKWQLRRQKMRKQRSAQPLFFFKNEPEQWRQTPSSRR